MWSIFFPFKRWSLFSNECVCCLVGIYWRICVPKLQCLNYGDRLIQLTLASIQYRQLKGDLIQTFKIPNQIDNIGKDDFFKISNIDSTRNSELKLQKPFARTNLRSNFFSHRVINRCNNLSSSTKSSKDLHSFKVNIDNELYHLHYTFQNWQLSF